MTAAWRQLRPHLTVPLVVLLVGFSFSLAANVAWSWDGGPVRVLGGALASLALPGAIHLYPRIPTAGAWSYRGRDWPVMRIVRAVVMTVIALLAAVTTLTHAASLLIAHGEYPALAVAYPVITELAVVMGALAHQAGRGGGAAARHKARPASAHDAGRVLAETPKTRTPREPLHAVDATSTSARARDWVRAQLAQGREPTGADVDAALGLEGKARCGARAVRQVLGEQAVS